MQKLEWSDKYLLGVKEFDEDHEHLFDLIIKSCDLIENTAPHARIEMILDELFEYAAYHFAAEEEWMNDHSYPKLSEHIAEHDIYRKKVAAFQNDFLAGKASPKLHLFSFLTEWLANHILETDFQYARFISEGDSSDGH